MRIHYLSVHSVLEWQEVSLLTELGHDVFSNGAYIRPDGHPSLPRPGIPSLTYHPEFERLAVQYPKTELPPELIDPFDAIIIMHDPNILVQNWPRIKHKKVIWRSIGQSLPHIERLLKPLQAEGLKIVRYSPMEQHLPDYAGANELIRFYGDPEDLIEWNGKDKKVINFTQSLKGRRQFCHYDHIMEMLAGFPAKVFGTGNEDLGNLNGGNTSYDLLKGQLRDSRVFVYGGTWPAPYTLSFIEAWMVGIPIVSIGKKLAENIPGLDPLVFFEIPDLITHGQNGFIANDMGELRSYIQQLLDNDQLAYRISKAARAKAIDVFGKPQIRAKWKHFLETL